MRLGKIKKLLILWNNNELISDEQKDSIFAFMKERQSIQLLRCVKWLFILGAFWTFFGLISTLKLINPDFFIKLYKSVEPVLRAIANIYTALEKLIGPNAEYLFYALMAMIVWGLFFWLGSRVRKRENLAEFKLDYFSESSLRLATVFFVLGYIAIGCAFSFLNRFLLPEDIYYYYSEQVKIIPIFYFAGVGFYFYCAYRLKDQIALLFAIYFVGLSVGCFSGYSHACYWLGVSRPIIQFLTAMILLLVGFIHLLSQEEEYQEYFGRTYQWTGLLMGFLALWVMSIWGVVRQEGYWYDPRAAELWFANILFIGASIGAMAFGAKSEDQLFLNYGLTFLIIATYTIFFTHIWHNLGASVGSLCLGIMLVATGYGLRKMWLEKRFFKKDK